MTSHYAYSWQLWPVVAILGLLAALAFYSWRHRSVPGALPFAAFTILSAPWLLGSALQLAVLDLHWRIFWVAFRSFWQLPAVTAALCFSLEYTNLGHWLTRRNVILLAIPSLIFAALIVTNDFHHLVWIGFSQQGYAQLQVGLAGKIFRAYGYLLSLLTPLAFVGLFLRSPLHRWPAALCILGQIVLRIAYVFSVQVKSPLLAVNAVVLAFTFLATVYALALFRYRLFDLIPIARGTMIGQMHEGMLILDKQHRVIDMNPAAEKIFGEPAASALGGDVFKLLPMDDALAAALDISGNSQFEICLGTEEAALDYSLHLSSLRSARGFPLGQLILLHDVTEQRRAQRQLVEQQRAVATLQERVRIARELHDGVAQILAYMRIQAEIAQSLLSRGLSAEANCRLSRLIASAQDAHTDVREYIVGAGTANGSSFFGALERYVLRFRENHGVATELTISPEVMEGVFEPTVEAQLLRMIQEALTNVRKHARAHNVAVSLCACDCSAEAIIRDDGDGFDAQQVTQGGQQFGLRFMRERAEEVGGTVVFDSSPGKGTRVIIRMPFRREKA